MVKKVIIAVAGQGTRMQELTKDKSKHLIEVNGKPFLFYVLDNLTKAGYDDFTLVVGFEAELIKKFVDDYGFKVKIINQFEILGPKEKIYGTACPLMCVENTQESFLYISGDNFYSVEDLKQANIDDEFNYIFGAESMHPEDFGVLVPFDLAQGRPGGEFLKEIVEKPRLPMGNLINVSLYKFTPEIFKKISQIEKSSRGEYEITDAVSLLAQEKKVKIKKMKGFWIDFGRPEDVKKLEDFLNGNNKEEQK
ncbi:MAG: sugar phosphate nucleotidyltransferase [Candidatus Staskawiczbacteria bacterium]|jgi:dTDP-glucose pyrophosphorylase